MKTKYGDEKTMLWTTRRARQPPFGVFANALYSVK
jgi:hypothetical protein